MGKTEAFRREGGREGGRTELGRDHQLVGLGMQTEIVEGVKGDDVMVVRQLARGGR